MLRIVFSQLWKFWGVTDRFRSRNSVKFVTVLIWNRRRFRLRFIIHLKDIYLELHFTRLFLWSLYSNSFILEWIPILNWVLIEIVKWLWLRVLILRWERYFLPFILWVWWSLLFVLFTDFRTIGWREHNIIHNSFLARLQFFLNIFLFFRSADGASQLGFTLNNIALKYYFWLVSLSVQGLLSCYSSSFLVVCLICVKLVCPRY